jgi:tetratricopeptide (TPR) repeat protein
LSKARQLFNKAVELDPQFARAYMALGRTHLAEGANGWGDAHDAYEKGVRLEEKAVDLDPAESWAYALLGEMTLYLGDFDRGFAAFDHALKLNPNGPDILMKFGGNLQMVGRAQEGVEMINRAFRLNPHNPAFYTLTLRKAEKSACQRIRGGFCWTDDPSRLSGQRIAARPD